MESTSMTQARRWMLVVLVLAVVAATVAVVVVMRSSGPPVINLTSAAGGDSALRATADEAVQTAPMYVAVVRFELAEGARFDAGEAVAYRLEPPPDLEGAAADLADRLGLDGDVAVSPWGEGALQVGPDDGSGPGLWVAPAGDWNYSDPTGQPQLRCVEPVAPEDVERGEIDRDVEMCEPMSPPEGVPDEDEASVAAEAFLAGLDLPGMVEITEVYADEWSAWVTATVAVDGIDTDLFASMSLGPDAVPTSASGTLARPVEVASYPTIDAAAAVERLEDQQGANGGLLLPGRVPADVPVDDVPMEVPADAPAERTDPEAPVSDDDVMILPAPDPAEETEDRLVTLVAFEPAMLLTIDAEGTVWLLPGVRFTDADGGTWQVITVADDYLAEQEAPDTAPLPTEPVPEPGVDPGVVEPGQPGQEPGAVPGQGPAAPEPTQPSGEAERLAQAVVGLDEADAVARIESAGLVARIVERDGEHFAVTDDLRMDRINLQVEAGTVTDARVG